MMAREQDTSFDPEYAIRFLNRKVRVLIDRPLGSSHPRYGFLYPVNYGYLPGVMAPDGEELDAYVLGVHHPIDCFEGLVIAVIQRMDDDDDKLVVAEVGLAFSDDAILERVDFQERFFQSTIVRTTVGADGESIALEPDHPGGGR